MHGYEHKHGELFAGQIPIHDIADQVGTPFYVYSAQGIESNFRALKDAFGARTHQINYAVKANPNLAILALLNNLGAGFDVVSGGELTRALKAGASPDNICFSGVGKSEAEIRLALESGIASINIESGAELERVQTIAATLDTVARIALRINPDVDAQTHEYISTGLKQNKFGIDASQAIALYRRAADLPNLEPTGLAYHIGSQIISLTPLVEATKKALELVTLLAGEGIVIEHLDMGGGLGIRYQDETPPSLAAYVDALVQTVDQTHPQLGLSIEPGRSIIGHAGVLVTRIEYLKTNNDNHFAIVDAAMNDLIRPSLYKAWMEICAVHEHPDLPAKLYDIVGPVCESADFLGKQRELAIHQGDLLAVKTAGAYAMSMSSNYNSRPRAAEVLVDGDAFHVIRQRETCEDLFALESIPEFITPVHLP